MSQAGSTAFVGFRYLFGLIDYKWGFTLVAPLWNTFLLLVALLVLTAFLARRHFLPLIGIGFLLASFLPKVLDYGYVAFIPVAILILLDRRWYGWIIPVPWRFYHLALSLSAAMALLYLFVFVQLSVLAGTHLVAGHSLDSSSGKLHELIVAPSSSSGLKKDDVVAFNSLSSPSLIVFGGQDIVFAGLGAASPVPAKDDLAYRYERMFNRVIRFYVAQQTYPYLKSDLAKVVWIGQQPFDLIADDWSSQHTLLESLIRPRHLANDYRTALYRRRE
jgi:hypothetical protein